MNKSVYIRKAVRELLGGQILLGFSDHETHAILTWQKVLEVALDGHFQMLFALFTRLNSALNRYERKNTVERAQRSERVAKSLLNSLDKWKQWEESRRTRYRIKLRKERHASQNLSV